MARSEQKWAEPARWSQATSTSTSNTETHAIWNSETHKSALLEWCVYLGHGPHNLPCGMGQVAASIDGGVRGAAAARTVGPKQTVNWTTTGQKSETSAAGAGAEAEAEAEAGQLRKAFGALAALA